MFYQMYLNISTVVYLYNFKICMYMCVCECIYKECKPKLLLIGCRANSGEQWVNVLKCKGLLSIPDLRSIQSRTPFATPFSNVTVSVPTHCTTIPITKQHDGYYYHAFNLNCILLFSLCLYCLYFLLFLPKIMLFLQMNWPFINTTTSYSFNQTFTEQLLCITHKNK